MDKIEYVECTECCGTGIMEECCDLCNGSGEGMHDTTRCMSCKGSGLKRWKCETCNGAGRIEIDEIDEDVKEVTNG